MHHIIFRNNNWHFSRRVPVHLKPYDKREYVRFSLKTDSKKQALRLAKIEDGKIERYWSALVETGQKHSHEKYKQLVTRAELFGFSYQPVKQIAIGEFTDLYERLLFVEKQMSGQTVEAVFGKEQEPTITLEEVLPIYLGLTKSVEVEKSERQYRKWKNPRILAMKNAITCLGNVELNKFTRQSANQLKNWYLERIKAKEITFSTADTHLVYIKTMICNVSEERKIEIDKTHIFNKFLFNKGDKRQRPPFSTAHIINVLLNPEKLAGTSRVNQALLKIFAETGACVDEIAGVRPEDIFLHEKIPHFLIRPHEKDKLKTKHRERLMPLTGYALEAFKEFPMGFSKLINDVDSTTSAIGKYLRQNKMLETEHHSTYSLRHSFQDRLTNADCPDRIQTDLMGHAFADRTKYGKGATLENSYRWMKRIQLNT